MMVNCFREVTMGAAIALREDYDGADLRRIAKGSKDAARIGATDPGDPWRGALAPGGPAALALAGVRHLLG